MSAQEPLNGVMGELDSTSAIAEETAMAVDSEGGQPVQDGEPVAKLQANERLLFCAEVLIGYKCEVQVRGWRVIRCSTLLLVGSCPTSCTCAAACSPPQGKSPPSVTHCEHCIVVHMFLVQLTDGTVYEGIFHTMKVDGKDAHVVLKYAKVVKDPTITAEGLQAIAKKPEVTKVIHSDDIAGVVAKDVRMAAEDLGSEQYDVGFETDATISRGRGG
jgi:hypothetical protein